jgi:spore germination cell wall hydrolase CwlJ-like protein
LSTGNALLLALMLATGANAKAADDICLKAVAYKEAGNQPVRGIAGVIQTIRHRAKKRKKSVCSVVRESHQFSSVKRGMNLRAVKIPKKFLHKFAEASKMRSVVSKCVDSFHSGAPPRWASKGKFDRRIADHSFYCVGV